MSENTWEIMKGMELGDVELQMALQCAPVITGVKVSNLLNIKLYSGADISYATDGQNVPDDIEVFDTQKIVKQLLGGRI